MNPVDILFISFLSGLFIIGVTSKRIQFQTYPWNQGWVFGIGIVPKSVRIGGVQYFVASILMGPIEIRLFLWRWSNAVS